MKRAQKNVKKDIIRREEKNADVAFCSKFSMLNTVNLLRTWKRKWKWMKKLRQQILRWTSTMCVYAILIFILRSLALTHALSLSLSTLFNSPHIQVMLIFYDNFFFVFGMDMDMATMLWIHIHILLFLSFSSRCVFFFLCASYKLC